MLTLTDAESFSFLLNNIWQADPKRRCRLKLVDTVIFRDGTPWRWLFTSEQNGDIMKKKTARLRSPSSIIKSLISRKESFCNNKKVTLMSKIAILYRIKDKKLEKTLVSEPDLLLILSKRADDVVAIQVLVDGYSHKISGVFEHSVSFTSSLEFETHEVDGDITTIDNPARKRYPISDSIHEILKLYSIRVLKFIETSTKTQVKHIVFDAVLDHSGPCITGARDICLSDLPDVKWFSFHQAGEKNFHSEPSFTAGKESPRARSSTTKQPKVAISDGLSNTLQPGEGLDQSNTNKRESTRRHHSPDISSRRWDPAVEKFWADRNALQEFLRLHGERPTPRPFNAGALPFLGKVREAVGEYERSLQRTTAATHNDDVLLHYTNELKRLEKQGDHDGHAPRGRAVHLKLHVRPHSASALAVSAQAKQRKSGLREAALLRAKMLLDEAEANQMNGKGRDDDKKVSRMCSGEFCVFATVLTHKGVGRTKIDNFRSRDCMHEIAYKSQALYKAEAAFLGDGIVADVDEEGAYAVRILPSEKTGSDFFENGGVSRRLLKCRELMDRCGGSIDASLAFVARSFLEQVSTKCDERMRGLDYLEKLWGTAPVADLRNQHDSAWAQYNVAYRKEVYSIALRSAHPSRFYKQGPVCEVCYKLYSYLDSYRDGVMFQRAAPGASASTVKLGLGSKMRDALAQATQISTKTTKGHVDKMRTSMSLGDILPQQAELLHQADHQKIGKDNHSVQAAVNITNDVEVRFRESTSSIVIDPDKGTDNNLDFSPSGHVFQFTVNAPGDHSCSRDVRLLTEQRSRQGRGLVRAEDTDEHVKAGAPSPTVRKVRPRSADHLHSSKRPVKSGILDALEKGGLMSGKDCVSVGIDRQNGGAVSSWVKMKKIDHTDAEDESRIRSSSQSNIVAQVSKHYEQATGGPPLPSEVPDEAVARNQFLKFYHSKLVRPVREKETASANVSMAADDARQHVKVTVTENEKKSDYKRSSAIIETRNAEARGPVRPAEAFISLFKEQVVESLVDVPHGDGIEMMIAQNSRATRPTRPQSASSSFARASQRASVDSTVVTSGTGGEMHSIAKSSSPSKLPLVVQQNAGGVRAGADQAITLDVSPFLCQIGLDNISSSLGFESAPVFVAAGSSGGSLGRTLRKAIAMARGREPATSDSSSVPVSVENNENNRVQYKQSLRDEPQQRPPQQNFTGATDFGTTFVDEPDFENEDDRYTQDAFDEGDDMHIISSSPVFRGHPGLNSSQDLLATMAVSPMNASSASPSTSSFGRGGGTLTKKSVAQFGAPSPSPRIPPVAALLS